MSTPPENFDLWKILAETNLIIKSHAHQYQILTLFLLPTAFSIIIYPFVLQKTFFFNHHQHQPWISYAPTLVNLLYIFIVSILSISGTAPITYTTIHALGQTPVDLVTSVKSILPSFLPLLAPLVIEELMFGYFSWPFVQDLVQIYVKHEKIFDPATILLRVVLFISVIYLQANWTLSFVIAVCESNKGSSKGSLKPLKRSSQLVKGKNWVALSVVLLFDLMYAAYFVGFYNVGARRTWGFLFFMMMSLVYMTMTLLLNMVSNVVLYFYCLEMHGEVPLPYSSLEEAAPLPHSKN